MGKGISNYTCSQCGYMAPKWMGKCPGCGLWNTFYEEMGFKDRSGQKKGMVDAVPLDSIGESECFRYVSGCGELDRVLGGGIVPGSLILIGGDPGIGKSTLLLQVAGKFTRIHNKKVIYLSGEESLKQIKLRSMRLGINSNSILLLNEQCLDTLDDYMEEINPELVIVDSIQTVFLSGLSSVPGSVAQLRECTAKIMDVAKKREKAFIIVGHVTKDGVLAGPKVLEHMVDVVIYFEGDKNFLFRILRGVKNRFGPTDEIGILEMNSTGLVEVADPSSLFLSFRQQEMIGSAIGATLEGTRPLLIEIQALVSPSGPGYPRRMASGIDQNRLALITAVLEKNGDTIWRLRMYILKLLGEYF
jgi:DNA repair protein RadA/Sms